MSTTARTLHAAELEAATRTSGSGWWTAGTAAAQRTIVLSGDPWAGQSWDLLSGTVCWDTVHGCWLVGVTRLVTSSGYGGQHIFGSTFVRRHADAGEALRFGDGLLAESAATGRGGGDPVTTRAEHLAWCKERALEYVETGDLHNAFASMTSDLNKHPETADHGGGELGMMLMMSGHLDTPSQMHEWIESYQ